MGNAPDSLPRLAELMLTFGSFVFTGVGLLLAAVTGFAGYVTYNASRLHKKLSNDFLQLREQQIKINNTLIVASDFAIASLPQITFTQQIPAAVIDDVGIIDEIFSGPDGAKLWNSIAAQPRASRLAYARAIYRLGLNPLSKYELAGGDARNARHSSSVIELLDLAMAATERTVRDPVSLRRDILVRRSQTFRQLQDFESAEKAAAAVGKLHREHDDMASKFLSQWCRSLNWLQLGVNEKSLTARHQAFHEAASHLLPAFGELFARKTDRDAAKGRERLTLYRAPWPGIELGSIAYYTAKALWASRFTRDSVADYDDPDMSASLYRAIDLSLLFYEDTRRQIPTDPYTNCIYNLCVPFLVAVKAALPDTQFDLEEFNAAFPDLASPEKLKDHAKICLTNCIDMIGNIRYDQSTGGARYIYTERTEQLDTFSNFAKDVRLIQIALETPQALVDFYRVGEP